jgi:hypothetical protein
MAWVKPIATKQDCQELHPRLRAEDIREMLATNPDGDTLEMLYESLEVSARSFAVMDDTGCIAIFGVRSYLGNGIPWMLASDNLFKNFSRQFIKQCKFYANRLVQDYEYSYNYIATTNVITQRWLTWLGFTINTAETVNYGGVDFHPFTFLRKSNV